VHGRAATGQLSRKPVVEQVKKVVHPCPSGC
jgi:hypothetical protein